MAERIVDALEPIEIETQDRDGFDAVSSPRERGIELLAEIGSVRQRGQRIVERQMRDPVLALEDSRRHQVEAVRQPPDLIIAMHRKFGTVALFQRTRRGIERGDRAGNAVGQAAAAKQHHDQPHHARKRNADLHRTERCHRRHPRIAE